MTNIERSVELAKRNPQLRELLQETHDEIHDWCGLDLTDEQIVDIYHNHPGLYGDALESGFDTLARESFADIICQKLLGISWPTYGEMQQREGGEKQFFAELEKKAEEKGYTVVRD